MTSTLLHWIVLAATATALLSLDLVLGVRSRRTTLAGAAIGTVAWTLAGLAFAGAMLLMLDVTAARDYVTVFVLEKSLSVDNVAVFAVVMTAFAVPAGRQNRVLLLGIVAAVVLRLVLITAGVSLVSASRAVLVAFGVVLLVAGIRMAQHHGGGDGPPPKVVTWLQRRRVDPTAAALLAIGLTDLVFAVDSVPAAFTVSTDAYVIVAANVFAVLGLRPAYALLAGAMDRLEYLRRALAVLLILIGVTLGVSPVWEPPHWAILVAVVAILGTGTLLSLVPPRRLLVAVSGGVLLVAGLAMLVLPGPGLLVCAAALALLATEFAWAKRWLDRARARLPRRRSHDATPTAAGDDAVDVGEEGRGGGGVRPTG